MCNGTATLVTAVNWWRAHNETLAFFQCRDAKPCLGGMPTGTCKPNFRGPMCALCADDHAGEECALCTERTVSHFIVGLIGVAYFVVIGLVIVKAVGKGHEHKGNALTIVFKIAVTYLQVLVLPPPLLLRNATAP